MAFFRYFVDKMEGTRLLHVAHNPEKKKWLLYQKDQEAT